MLRFDKDRDNHIKYSEFCDAFLPIDSFHASLLAKKAPLNTIPLSSLPRTEVFYSDTRKVFAEAWRVIFQNEVENDKLRIGSQRRPGFSSHDAFLALDSDHDSFLDKEDLRIFFSRRGQYVPDKELCGLIERYDKNRDGRISYTEFAAELTPRCLM
jgi:hypothetical protein